MVDTSLYRNLFERFPQRGRDRKGLGYNIEAFVAVLTLFVFALGSLQSPADVDWTEFQTEVAAKDAGYVLKETGTLDELLERGETGSIQTAASTITGDQLQVSGNVRGLPIGEHRIGFHVNDDGIDDFETEQVSGSCEGELEEIEETTDEDVMKTQETEHGVHLYIADADPEVVGDSEPEENRYDSVWVDNGTQCQFAAADGPYYMDEFFWWGDGDEGTYYDIEHISEDGDYLTLYEADQPVRFKNTAGSSVNNIKTDVRFDTFNFSKPDLSTYDVLVFRREETLELIENNEDKETEVLEFLEDGSVLFLVDLEEDNFGDPGDNFMSRAGLEWLDLDWEGNIEGAGFSDTRDSRDVRNLFEGQNPEEDVSLLPGGDISSGDRELVYAGSGFYDTTPWNATNTSAEEIEEGDLPEGVPESDCTDENWNYWKAEFIFPDDEYFVYGSRLECDDNIWSMSIDLDKNGQIEDEQVLLEGDTVDVDGREHHVVSHLSNGADFVYIENQLIELVNHRTEFPDRDIHKFARAGYQEEYEPQDRELLSAVIYWLAMEEKQFGPEQTAATTTTVVGGIKNEVYMPYRVDLRWER